MKKYQIKKVVLKVITSNKVTFKTTYKIMERKRKYIWFGKYVYKPYEVKETYGDDYCWSMVDFNTKKEAVKYVKDLEVEIK